MSLHGLWKSETYLRTFIIITGKSGATTLYLTNEGDNLVNKANLVRNFS